MPERGSVSKLQKDTKHATIKRHVCAQNQKNIMTSGPEIFDSIIAPPTPPLHREVTAALPRHAFPRSECFMGGVYDESVQAVRTRFHELQAASSLLQQFLGEQAPRDAAFSREWPLDQRDKPRYGGREVSAICIERNNPDAEWFNQRTVGYAIRLQIDPKAIVHGFDGISDYEVATVLRPRAVVGRIALAGAGAKPSVSGWGNEGQLLHRLAGGFKAERKNYATARGYSRDSALIRFLHSCIR